MLEAVGSGVRLTKFGDEFTFIIGNGEDKFFKRACYRRVNIARPQ